MKPNITQVVKRTFTEVYGRPMVSAFVNLTWFFLSLFILPLGPVTLGVYHFARELRKPGSTNFNDFMVGVKKYWFYGLLVSLTQLALFAILAVDWYFLFTSEFVTSLDIIYRTALYFFGLYLTIFLFLVFFYMYPLVVNTERGLLSAFSRAFFIPMQFPVFSLALGGTNLLIFIVSILFPPLLLLYFAVVGALLGDNSLSYLIN